ncbi:MAG: methylated-DNA--[protein]-cysteine S-methyltransferase [Actinomycetota bacterium]
MDSGGGEGASAAARAVAAACRVLDAEECLPTLAELGRRVGMSPSHLQRSFKRLLGMTPRQYGAEVLLERARRILRTGAPVTDALFEAGYGSSRAFYEGARAGLGMTPSAYRRRGLEQRITYTVVASGLGDVLVATTPEGVCLVRFLDARARDVLAAEFPAAAIERDDGALAEVAARVVAAVAGDDGPGAELPLDVRATAFQLRVWQALRAIPRGQTRSYAEVAATIGRPTAVRAVAGACAANPVALLVPCHRVVASDGSLAGYRWGTGRKRALLEAEGWAGPGSAP